MSFYVPYVQAKYEKLQLRGNLKVIFGLVQIAPNMRGFYSLDPDDVPVEFPQLMR
jgi:hypothetical protein